MRKITFKSARLLSVLFLSGFFCCLFPSLCQAQRTSAGSYIVSVSPGISARTIPSGSLELQFGQYTLGGYWQAGIKGTDWIHAIVSGGTIASTDMFDHCSWRGHAGYMWRLVGSYNRAFNLYLGGCVFLGLNQYEAFIHLPENYSSSYPAAEFIYGAEPELEFEMYLGSRIALLLEGQVPLTLGQKMKNEWWNITASIGLRVMF